MNIKIAIKIYEYRQLKRLTTRQLAALAGVSRSTISDAENGKHDITLSTLIKIAVALGVLPEDLYSYEFVRDAEQISKSIDNKS